MNETLNSATEQNYQQNSTKQNPWEKMAQEAGEFQEKNIEAKKAEITQIEDNVFKIEGVLTETNIAEINERKNNTTYIIENTAGLTSDVLKQIKAEGVLFSVKGGLDYEHIEKYNTDNYRERTMMSPKGLEKAVSYFEHIESGINPEWNDLQKAMYEYGCLADDFTYGEDTDDIMSKGTAARGLNGILYGELVCAGFAFAYQEMMNRQGIECHYSNQKDTHAYNVLRLDDKYYGVDVTWDNGKKAPDGKCGFRQFGRDEQFYDRFGHQNYTEVADPDDFDAFKVARVYDEEEPRFSLSTFTVDELQANYRVIADTLDRREVGAYKGFANLPKEKRETYLPIDTIERQLVREADQDYNKFVSVLQELRSDGNLQIDPKLVSAIAPRVGYVLDITEQRYRGNADSYFDPNDLESYDVIAVAKNIGINPTPAPDTTVIERLNNQLFNNLNQYILDTFSDMPAIVNNYEYDPVNSDLDRRTKEGNAFTKMQLVLRSKDLLVENGIPEDEIESVFATITTKLEDTHKPFEQPQKSRREYSIDFLSGAFADRQGIKTDVENVEGKTISDEEFNQKVKDPNYMLTTVYPNLKLEEYDLTVDDFSKILNGELPQS